MEVKYQKVFYSFFKIFSIKDLMNFVIVLNFTNI